MHCVDEVMVIIILKASVNKDVHKTRVQCFNDRYTVVTVIGYRKPVVLILIKIHRMQKS